jgi:hypothetical protein
LISRELDALILPEIERKKAFLESKVQAIGDRMLEKVERMMADSMAKALSDVVDYQLRGVLERATNSVRIGMHEAIKDSVGPATNR